LNFQKSKKKIGFGFELGFHGFLDWIWMGNPNKIQNPNPKKIQKSMKSMKSKLLIHFSGKVYPEYLN
jgi:hypothetical protein